MLFLPIEGKVEESAGTEEHTDGRREGPDTSSEIGKIPIELPPPSSPGQRQRRKQAANLQGIFSGSIEHVFFLLNVWDNVILSDTYTSRPPPAPSANDSDGNGNEQRRPRPPFPVAKGFWRKARCLATPFYHPIFHGTLSAPYIPSLFQAHPISFPLPNLEPLPYYPFSPFQPQSRP